MHIYLNRKAQMPPGIRMNCISWDWSDDWLAIGSSNGSLKLFHLDSRLMTERPSGKITESKGEFNSSTLTDFQSCQGHNDDITILSWNHQFGKIASADISGLIIVWGLKEGKWTQSMKNVRNKSRVVSLRWSNNGKYICIAYYDGCVVLGDVNGNRLWTKDMKVSLLSVEWSPCDQYFIVANKQGIVGCYDSQCNLVAPIVNHTIAAPTSTSSIATIVTWYKGKSKKNLQYDSSLEKSLLHSSPGLAIGYDNHKVQIMRSISDTKPIVIDTNLGITELVWHPDGSILTVVGITAQKQFKCQLYNAGTGAHLRTISLASGNDIVGLAWECSGSRFVIATQDCIHIAYARFPDTVLYAQNHVIIFKPQTNVARSSMLVFPMYKSPMFQVKSKTGVDNIKPPNPQHSIKLISEATVLSPTAVSASQSYYSTITSVPSGVNLPSNSIITLYEAEGRIFETRILCFIPHLISMNDEWLVASDGKLIYCWKHHNDLKKDITQMIDHTISKTNDNSSLQNNSDSITNVLDPLIPPLPDGHTNTSQTPSLLTLKYGSLPPTPEYLFNIDTPSFSPFTRPDSKLDYIAITQPKSNPSPSNSTSSTLSSNILSSNSLSSSFPSHSLPSNTSLPFHLSNSSDSSLSSHSSLPSNTSLSSSCSLPSTILPSGMSINPENILLMGKEAALTIASSPNTHNVVTSMDVGTAIGVGSVVVIGRVDGSIVLYSLNDWSELGRTQIKSRVDMIKLNSTGELACVVYDEGIGQVLRIRDMNNVTGLGGCIRDGRCGTGPNVEILSDKPGYQELLVAENIKYENMLKNRFQGKILTTPIKNRSSSHLSSPFSFKNKPLIQQTRKQHEEKDNLLCYWGYDVENNVWCRNGVWNIMWSREIPDALALQERGKLCLYRSGALDSSYSCDQYLLTFDCMQALTVGVDQIKILKTKIMSSMYKYTKMFAWSEFELTVDTVSSERDMRDLINNARESNLYCQVARCWEKLSYECVLRNYMSLAEECMEESKIYPGIRWVKKMQTLPNDFLRICEVVNYANTGCAPTELVTYTQTKKKLKKKEKQNLRESSRNSPTPHLDATQVCISRGDFRIALKILMKITPRNYILEEECWEGLGKQFLASHEYHQALQCFIRSRNVSLCIGVCHELEDYTFVLPLIRRLPGYDLIFDHEASKNSTTNTSLNNPLEQPISDSQLIDIPNIDVKVDTADMTIPDDKELLSTLGCKLNECGYLSEAVVCYIRAGEISQALVVCMQANNWDLAIKLGEQYHIDNIGVLLRNRACELVESGLIVEATQVFYKAECFDDSIQLLSQIGTTFWDRGWVVFENNLEVKPLKKTPKHKISKSKTVEPLPEEKLAKLAYGIHNAKSAKKLAVLKGLLFEKSMLLRETELSSENKQRKPTTLTLKDRGSNIMDLLDRELTSLSLNVSDNSNFQLDQEAKSLVDARRMAWFSAEAWHYLLLAHTLIYHRRYEDALVVSLRLSAYEKIVGEYSVQSLIAFTALQSHSYFEASVAISRLVSHAKSSLSSDLLSPQQTASIAELINSYQRISVDVFINNPPNAPSILYTPCKLCNNLVSPSSRSCSICSHPVVVCMVSGQPILNEPSSTCSSCQHSGLLKYMTRKKNCPLCHQNLNFI